MSTRRPKPIYSASAYVRNNIAINELRSGIASPCPQCAQAPGAWCISKRGKNLLYNHKGRVEVGKRAADALIAARVTVKPNHNTVSL